MHKDAPRDVVNRQFTTTLFALATDPVPNIRFSVSKTLCLLVPAMSEPNKLKCTEILEKQAESDEDFDAKFFAKKTLE